LREHINAAAYLLFAVALLPDAQLTQKTARRFRVTIVAVEKQLLLHNLCVWA